MEDRSHAIIAIIFLAIFGLGAAAVTWWMMTPGAARVPYLLESEGSVAGLGPGSPVVYKGVQVGSVNYVRLDAKTHRRVNVLIRVDKSFPLTRNSYATLGSNGLIGNKNIDLHLGAAGPVLHTSDKRPARLELKPGEIGRLMQQAGGIVVQVKQTLAAVKTLVSGKNAQAISRSLAYIERASRKLVTLEDRTGAVLRRLPPLLRRTDAAVEQGRRLLATTNRLVVAAGQPVRAIRRAANSAAMLGTRLNQESVPQINALLLRLRTLGIQLQTLIKQLNRSPQSLILGPTRPPPGPGERRPGGTRPD